MVTIANDLIFTAIASRLLPSPVRGLRNLVLQLFHFLGFRYPSEFRPY